MYTTTINPVNQAESEYLTVIFSESRLYDETEGYTCTRFRSPRKPIVLDVMRARGERVSNLVSKVI